MNIINVETVEKNGLEYERTTYDNGAIVEVIKSEPVELLNENILTDEETATLEMQANIEYLVAMFDIMNM